MKKLVLGLLLMISFLNSNAQDINYSIEKTIVKPDLGKAPIVIEKNQDGNTFIAFKDKDRWYHFQTCNAKGDLTKEVVSKGEGINFFTYKNKAYAVKYAEDKSTGNISFYLSSSDMTNLELSETKLFSLKGKTDFLYSAGVAPVEKNMSVFSTVTSGDKSVFCITVDLPETKKNENPRKVYVFDTEKQQLIYEYTFNKPEEDKRVYFYKDMEVINKEVYLLSYVKERANVGYSKWIPYYEIQKITSDGLVRQMLDSEKSAPKLLSMVKKNDKIALAGLYGDLKSLWVTGVCYFDVDPTTMKVTTSKYHPYPAKFNIDKYGKEKGKEEKAPGDFKGFYLTDKNEIIFNAEEASLFNNLYSFDDIIVAKINENGDLAWIRNINKNQKTQSRSHIYGNGEISYTSLLKDGDQYLFTNCNEKTNDLGNGRYEFSDNKADLLIIKIDKTGNITYKKIQDNKDEKITFLVFNGSVNPKENSVLFYGSEDAKKEILKITLQ